MSAEKSPSPSPVMKAYTIKIKSGEHAGRYVGGRFGGGLVTNPEVQENPPVNVPGSTKYGLWAQEKAAMILMKKVLLRMPCGYLF